MGDAVNLAARMEQTASAGTVQISEATYKHIAPIFDVEALGAIEVKGKRAAQPTYQVLGRKAAPGRKRGITGLVAPLIGRQAEFEGAAGMMRSLKEGRGGLLMLMGEAGLGKSRLIEELRLKWIDEGNGDAWHETRGISYDASRPYTLFRSLLRAFCTINDQDSPALMHEKAQAAIDQAPEGHRAALQEVVRILLEVETGEREEIEGEALKKSLFKNLAVVVAGEAGKAPLAIVLDDLHWADPASMELLLHLLPLIEKEAVLFICAMRPHRKTPGWQVKQVGESDYPHRYEEIHLKPLTAVESQELVDSLLDISELPPELHQMIMRKAEGNPFFVEEVVRTLIDNEFVRRVEGDLHWVSTQRVADIDIPDNLQGLLAARIDRLQNDVRQTLQLAAVIGRSFYYRVLEAISELSDSLEMQLNTLQRVELIREAARVPELEYIFRHELTRDAAYGTILRRQRRQFHLQVAETIEELFPDKLEEEAHRLGYHFAQARENERALRYYTLAAEAAARLYANREAADHYKEAIKFAQKVGISIEDLNDLYIKGGRALELSGGYEEAIGLYKELEQMGEEQGEPAMVLAALTPQATIASVPTEQYDAEHSKALTDRALKLARELKDPRAEAKALWNKMLVSYFIEGNSQLSLEYGEKAQVIAREHGLKEELAFTLHDSVRPFMSIGDVGKSAEVQAEALALWREMGNMPMTADNLTMAATNAYYQGDLTGALELGEEALRISQSIDSLWGQAYSKGNIAPVFYELGEIGKAMRAFQDSAELAKEANFMAAQFSNLYLALILADLGAFEEAQKYTNKAGNWVSEGEMTMGRYVRALDAFILARKGEAKGAWKSLESALDDFQDLNLEAVENVLVEPIKVEVALVN
ncbi:MAG: AAA family ATPase, partial [Anaerolineae bacterium]|nr:AAA family ATPase [Anaerolineae bacterium]